MENNYTMSVETLRTILLSMIYDKPELGKDYIDWHTEDSGECGVTISLGRQKFDIIIRHAEQ
jgi:hypothetical protein